MRDQVLPFAEVLAQVLAEAEQTPLPLSTESVSLDSAAGRVLAETLTADRDQPPFARSTRDGFALRAEDLEADGGVTLRKIGLVRAGEQWTGAPLAARQALEIMTGAPLPPGADAVLMVEHAEVAGDELRPEPGRRLRSGENVVPQGAEAARSAALVPPGRHLGVAEIALAANCGRAQLAVYPRPAVAIVATGDELVEVADTPQPWQIRNSNSYSLAALVEAEGARAHRLRAAQDTLDDLRSRLAEAAAADLLLLSGGVSMGKFDLVEQALAEAGAEFLFTGALIQPGKPIVFGYLPRGARRQFFFGLPGNPISTEVCFRLFVTPLLRRLAGQTALAPQFSEARLATDVAGGARVTRFLPAVVSSSWQEVTVQPVPWQGSGDLAANARANAFVVLPAGIPAFSQGETVRVLLR